MNIYLVPIFEDNTIYIRKIAAKNEKYAAEKLYDYLFNKYDWLEGDNLEDIINPLFEKDIIVGDIYEADDFTS